MGDHFTLRWCLGYTIKTVAFWSCLLLSFGTKCHKWDLHMSFVDICAGGNESHAKSFRSNQGANSGADFQGIQGAHAMTCHLEEDHASTPKQHDVWDWGRDPQPMEIDVIFGATLNYNSNILVHHCFCEHKQWIFFFKTRCLVPDFLHLHQGYSLISAKLLVINTDIVKETEIKIVIINSKTYSSI